MPSSDGSSRISRVNTPSVTTSMRVLRDTLEPKPHAQADRVADLLAERRRHPLGRGAGGEPARLQHQDFAGLRPTARRAAPAARAWSCRRRAARPARRRCRGSAAVSAGSAASMGSGSANARMRAAYHIVPDVTSPAAEPVGRVRLRSGALGQTDLPRRREATDRCAIFSASRPRPSWRGCISSNRAAAPASDPVPHSWRHAAAACSLVILD